MHDSGAGNEEYSKRDQFDQSCAFHQKRAPRSAPEVDERDGADDADDRYRMDRVHPRLRDQTRDDVGQSRGDSP